MGQFESKIYQTIAPICIYFLLTALKDRCSMEVYTPRASSRVPGKAKCGAHLSSNLCTNHTILLYPHMRIYMAVLPKYNGDFTNFIEPIIKRPMLSQVATHSTATAYLRLILMGSKTRGRIWTRVWRTFPWSHQFDEARQLPKAESAFFRIFPLFLFFIYWYAALGQIWWLD